MALRALRWPNITADEVDWLFGVFGGVPRLVLENADESAVYKQLLDDSIATADLQTIRTLIGEAGAMGSGKIIHICVPTCATADGKLAYDFTSRVTEFASPYVKEKVVERLLQTDRLFLASLMRGERCQGRPRVVALVVSRQTAVVPGEKKAAERGDTEQFLFADGLTQTHDGRRYQLNGVLDALDAVCRRRPDMGTLPAIWTQAEPGLGISSRPLGLPLSAALRFPDFGRGRACFGSPLVYVVPLGAPSNRGAIRRAKRDVRHHAASSRGRTDGRDAPGLLGSVLFSGSLYGLLFEPLVHSLLAKGGSFPLRWLSPLPNQLGGEGWSCGDRGGGIKIDIRPQTAQLFKNTAGLADLGSNAYDHPLSGNFPAVDAVLILDSATLLFQCTVSNRRNIAAAPLAKVLKALPAAAPHVAILLFVVPLGDHEDFALEPRSAALAAVATAAIDAAADQAAGSSATVGIHDEKRLKFHQPFSLSVGVLGLSMPT